MPMTSESEFATGLSRASLDPERGTPIDTPWGKYALHLVGDEVVCTQAFCPHMDGPLFEGTRSGSRLVCPWHSWIYDLSTCERVDSGEDEGRCLSRLSVVDRGEEGLVVLSADSTEE